VDIIADTVQFLASGQRDENGGGSYGGGGGGGFQPRSDVPADMGDFAPAPAPVGGNAAPTADDDIPF
jgi:single-stranded DNA-binding protein